MSQRADTAFRVADRLRTEPPWDVFAERSRRYELHLNGPSLEIARGPIAVEGFGVRVFRARGDKVGVGFQASTELSDEGIRTAAQEAVTVAGYSEFPAKRVDLPTAPRTGVPEVPVRDPRLWDRPMESLQEYVSALFAAFEGQRDVTLSFGSIRATLTEASLANSAGLELSHAHTTIELEVAVKAFGGPEGAPPGEYWVNDSSRHLGTDRVPGLVEEWCRYARDVRRAKPTPSGDLPVVLPAAVLNGILPPVIGFRLTGAARLLEMAPKTGDAMADPAVTIHDDGLLPWAVASGPVDDEGTPQHRRTLIARGASSELLYDALHAGAFGVASSGSAMRTPALFRDWRRFLHRPSTSCSTLVVEPGTGGTDAELIEAAHDGVWVQQLGWAIPDGVSTSFGGELRIGYRIRGGKLAEPVRGGTVGGVVLAPSGSRSLLHDVAAIGSRSTLAETIATPSLLVRPLTVAGS